MSASSTSHRRTQDRAETTDALLAALRRSTTATISDLTQETSYSRPTVTTVLDQLVHSGIIRETTTEDQRPGRPATAWTIRADAGTVIGIDLLATSMLLTAVRLDGHVITARQLPVPNGNDADQRLDAVTSAVNDLVSSLQDSGPLRAVGVSVTGVVDGEGVIRATDYVPVWNAYPLAQRLREALDTEVVVENDINMEAFGEFTLRQQRGDIADDGDLLLIQFTRGPRTGLILDGQVRRGRGWRAGEVSDLIDLHPDDEASPSQEWVERTALAIASVTAVVDLAKVVVGTTSPIPGRTMAQLTERLAVLSSQTPGRLHLESSELGAAGSVIGAVHSAFQRANQVITGAAHPRPVNLGGTDAIHQALSGSPHTLLNLVTSTTTSQCLRVGIVGVGARSRLALAAEREENNARITAVCDPHPLVRERVRERLGKDPDSLTITDTVNELITSGIDVAFVTSPDDTHASATIELLTAGVPVYLEKPLAINLADATAILTTAYRTGTPLYVGHNMRHMDVVRSMRDIIRSGRIGEVKAIWCRHFVGHGGDFYFKDWHAEREHVGGLLLQKAAHDIDVMHWLADSHTTDVVAMGGLTVYDQVTDRADNTASLMTDWFSRQTWPPLSQKNLNPVIDVEDLSMVLMRMESGVYASYQQCHYTPDYWRNYTVIGTEGRIENFGDGEGGAIRLWASRSDYSPEGDAAFPIRGDAGGHGDADVLTVGEFFRFVRHGAPTDTSPLGAWYAVAAGIQATESLRHGSQPATVPALDADIVHYFTHNQHH